MSATQQYDDDRKAAYAKVENFIRRRIDAIPVTLASGPSLLSPAAAQDAARRDVWTLFLNGVKHLSEGGPENGSGDLHAAVAKASLRSTPLAASLNLPLPRFDDHAYFPSSATGAEEARFFCFALIGAALADAPRSRVLLQRQIAAGILSQPPEQAGINDPELARVYGAARRSGQSTSDLDAAIRRQAVMSLNMLGGAYTEVAATLKSGLREIFAPQPKPPAPKGQSFDF